MLDTFLVKEILPTVLLTMELTMVSPVAIEGVSSVSIRKVCQSIVGMIIIINVLVLLVVTIVNHVLAVHVVLSMK